MNTPSNIQTDIIKMSNTEFTIIMVVIAVLVIIISALILQYFVKRKEIKKLQNFINQTLNEEEHEVITRYRRLDNKDKNAVLDTLKKLNNIPNQDDGN